MKTKIFTYLSGLALCLLGMLNVSCEKVSQDEIKPLAYTNVGNMVDGSRPKFFAAGAGSCSGKGGDCIGGVIVIGHPPQQREALDTYFNTMTGKPDAVASFFNGEQWATYFPELMKESNADCLAGLRSGAFDIIRLESENSSFYVAGPGEVTLDNHALVMPVYYQ